MKEKTKAYMAGLMDADGTFTITSCVHTTLGHKLYDPTVSCTSVHLPTLRWVVKHFGGTIYFHKITNTSVQPRYDWVTQTYLHSERFISLVRPYLLQKSEQADLLLEFYSLYRQQCPTVRQSLYERIKAVNITSSLTTNTSSVNWKPNCLNAYLAGFFDGEGSFQYLNNGTTLRVHLGNTNFSLLGLLKKTFGGHIYDLGGASRPEHRKPMKQWSLGKRADLEKFFLSTLPYLITKRKDALAGLENVRR